jgi:hypothetical protein
MPKVERLVKLARLTREREAVSIREMSEACGVSQRTIYRYLNTLSGLDFNSNLGRLSTSMGEIDREAEGWSREDVCLLCYVLQNNPLTAYPFFRKRLKKLRRTLLAERAKGSLRGSNDLVTFARSGSGGSDVKTSKLLEKFERARKRRSEVELQLTGRRRKPLRLRPLAIKVAGSRVFVEFSVPDQRKRFEIDIRQVRSLRLLRRSANRHRAASRSAS